ncbi:hypothetical protein GCM10007989_26820 [Devosia pacifica]|uniref:Uncharacterized protein n=1 Tax=Devosia pacifica TaxID=1335967 RepID=A0A918S859_9HYPH|nr:hypothetical protein GCM10007989_26820 [Devosia pacifica]
MQHTEVERQKRHDERKKTKPHPQWLAKKQCQQEFHSAHLASFHKHKDRRLRIARGYRASDTNPEVLAVNRHHVDADGIGARGARSRI